MQSRLRFSIAARRSLQAQIWHLNSFGFRLLSGSLQRRAASSPQFKPNVVLRAGINDDAGKFWEGSREAGGQTSPNPDELIVYEGRTRGHLKELTPPQLLARYLDAKDTNNTAELRSIVVDAQQCRLSLPLILLHYFLNGQNKSLPRISISQDRCHQYLQSRGWTVEDVEIWANILDGNNTDEMARQFCSASSKMPIFVLLEILRRNLSSVDSLKMILTWVQNLINQLPIQTNTRHDIGSLATNYPREPSHLNMAHIRSVTAITTSTKEDTFKLSGSRPHSYLEMNSFDLLISRLIRQARHVWPSALSSIAQLVGPYMRAMPSSKSKDPRKLEYYHFKQCSRLLNKIMRQFARPAFLEPYKSMIHNWTAQKILLRLAKEFEPSLLLDQGSYRAIIQVLAALKKSDDESKSAILRSPTWPPWRVHQDGMDAQRSIEDDWSRVIRAIMRLKEAGYYGDWYEEAMKVIGGQDFDGTPTIQHRKLFAPQLNKTKIDLEMIPRYWATRITATRNIQEAWGAFLQFQKNGGIPDRSMYLAMFEKLNYDCARLGRSFNHKYDASPGDGKEVFPVPDNNFSEDYRLHHQPPQLEILYEEMLQTGIRPSGNLLHFLLTHARTLDDGFRYLKDSDLSPAVIHHLCSFDHEMIFDPKVLHKISNKLLASFVQFLCRFAPRALSISTNTSQTKGLRSGSLATEKLIDTGEQWHILENSRSQAYSNGLYQPLNIAASLLNTTQPRYRPAWYPLFKALARDDIVVSRKLVGRPENRFLAWQILVAALNDFHHCGLQLDPRGFLFICQGFQGYASASYISEGSRLEATKASELIKTEFRKLSRISKEPDHMKLLYAIRTVHLHNYVRCLGLVGDFREIIKTLKWMTQQHKELEMNIFQDRNGYRQLRRTLVAVRFFCSGTDYLSTARELVESVESWDGWPEDNEVEEYLRWTQRSGHESETEEMINTTTQ